MADTTRTEIEAFVDAYQPQPWDQVFDSSAAWADLHGALLIESEGRLMANTGESLRELSSYGRLTPSMFHIAHKPPCWPRLVAGWAYVKERLFTGWTDLQALVAAPSATEVSEEVISYVLRAACAAGLVEHRDHAGRNQFKLTEFIADSFGRTKYVSSLASELAATHDRLQLLINHMPTLGSYRETLLRSFLASHLPRRYHVATGFILGDLYSPKGQLDVLIYDQQDYSPVFRQGDLVVVHAAAVRAVIEVKSRLTTAQLDDALELLDENTRREVVHPPFFKGIFAFDSKIKTPETIARHVKSYYNSAESTPIGPAPRRLMRQFQVVDAIAVSGKACVLASHDLSNGPPELRAVVGSQGDCFTAAFLWSLATYLDISTTSKRLLLSSLGGAWWSQRRLEPVHDPSWRPRTFKSQYTASDVGQLDFLHTTFAWRAGQIQWPSDWEAYLHEESAKLDAANGVPTRPRTYADPTSA